MDQPSVCAAVEVQLVRRVQMKWHVHTEIP